MKMFVRNALALALLCAAFFASLEMATARPFNLSRSQPAAQQNAASAQPCYASPPVALSAESAPQAYAAPQPQRDTRYDWQDRIRENRDRYAN